VVRDDCHDRQWTFASSRTPAHRHVEEDGIGIQIEQLAAMPVKILLPVRLENHQTQDSGSTLWFCPSPGIATVESEPLAQSPI